LALSDLAENEPSDDSDGVSAAPPSRSVPDGVPQGQPHLEVVGPSGCRSIGSPPSPSVPPSCCGRSEAPPARCLVSWGC